MRAAGGKYVVKCIDWLHGTNVTPIVLRFSTVRTRCSLFDERLEVFWDFRLRLTDTLYVLVFNLSTSFINVSNVC